MAYIYKFIVGLQVRIDLMDDNRKIKQNRETDPLDWERR